MSSVWRGRTSGRKTGSCSRCCRPGRGRNDDTEIHEDTEDAQPRRHEDTKKENPKDLWVSVSLWLVDLCVLVLPLWSRGGTDELLADRAAAAALARARHQVPALRASDAAQRPAGRGGAASRA